MSTNVREELKAFEKDLASLVARFIRLYEHLEGNVRPESRQTPPVQAAPGRPATQGSKPQAVAATLLPGYQ